MTPGTTKERIVVAAIETLKDEGFAGTSARAIAKRGGFNQALIFYHFGTLTDLLLAALDRTSRDRMERYREVLSGVEKLEDKLRVATELYREDLDSGHITVLSEMIAGSVGRPDLGPQIVERLEPWVDFAEDAVRDVLTQTGLDQLVPPRTAAYAIVALYLGIDLLSHLEEDEGRSEALFEAAAGIAPMIANLFGGGVG